MNFCLNKITLWLNNGSVRELKFEPNKVNVITGDSSTGKSSIIKIVDYCFFASEGADISHRFIGENVSWYGINFKTGDKHYTIARGSTLTAETRKQYFFSDVGDIPDLPDYNIDEEQLKRIIEKEFGIDAETVFAFGSANIKSQAKISLRYFLWIFNIQSQRILPSERVLFEKQNEERYRDALLKLRILDLVIGASSLKNIQISNQIEELNRQIRKVEKLRRSEEDVKFKFDVMLGEMVETAKAFQLLSRNITTPDKIVDQFEQLIYQGAEPVADTEASELDNLRLEKTELLLQLRALRTYYKAYDDYKKLLVSDADSLQPIEYIKRNFSHVISSKSTKRLIEYLDSELREIKSFIKGKDNQPLAIDLTKRIKETERKIDDIDEQIREYTDDVDAVSERKKYMFLGEVKTKLEMYKKDFEAEGYENKIEVLEKDIRELENSLEDPEQEKGVAIDFLNGLIDKNLDILKLEDYRDCKAYFNESKMRLDLRESESMTIHSMPQISSASSCMYLHLAFFVALHELFLTRSTPYVPSILILDQVSTPYYESAMKAQGVTEIDDVDLEQVSEDDRSKLTRALKLLNVFINRVNKNLDKEFQVILLEHVPESLWKEEQFENFHLVDKEFRGGYKLINIQEN